MRCDKGVDAFTTATCILKEESLPLLDPLLLSARECVSEHGKALCIEMGGICTTTRDGYYWTSGVCILLGAAVLLGFVQPAGLRLQGTFSTFDDLLPFPFLSFLIEYERKTDRE